MTGKIITNAVTVALVGYMIFGAGYLLYEFFFIPHTPPIRLYHPSGDYAVWCRGEKNDACSVFYMPGESPTIDEDTGNSVLNYFKAQNAIPANAKLRNCGAGCR
jgi:hypothetical protein